MRQDRDSTVAETMGIIIGKTVKKIDWYRFDKFGLEGNGSIIERDNLITVSDGDMNWRLFVGGAHETEMAVAA